MRSGHWLRLWDVTGLAPAGGIIDAYPHVVPDPRILELVQDQHGQAMLGFAMRLSLDPDRARDAVQETLFRLWRELSRGAAIEDPAAWSSRGLDRLRDRLYTERVRWPWIASNASSGPRIRMSPDTARLPSGISFRRMWARRPITNVWRQTRRLFAFALVIALAGATCLVLLRRPIDLDPGIGETPAGLVGSALPTAVSGTPPETSSPLRACAPGDLATSLVRTQSSGTVRQETAALTIWIRWTMQGATPCAFPVEPDALILGVDGRTIIDSRWVVHGYVVGPLGWAFAPGSVSGGEVRVMNWCGEAGPSPYLVQIDAGPLPLGAVAIDQLPPCIDARDPAMISGPSREASTIVEYLPSVAAASPACRGIGVDGHLAGDAADQRMAWLERADGTRTELVWPHGYRARFSGDAFEHLQILDASGDTVIRAGDPMTGACATADPSVLLVVPPFR